MANITKFSGITINGKDFSDSDVVRDFAREWSVNDELFWVADSLFDIADDADGVTEELSKYLANPENADDPEYSDIFKDMYGYRPY